MALNTQTIAFTPVDNKRLANLCGVLDEHLKQIENALGSVLAPPQSALATA